MKAILVIDMPNNCEECPCFYDWLHCQAKDGLCVLGDERPEGCPLKPMPQKQTLAEGLFDEEGQIVMRAYFNGYNACIEEIEDD